jgi:hypothetical protein
MCLTVDEDRTPNLFRLKAEATGLRGTLAIIEIRSAPVSKREER